MNPNTFLKDLVQHRTYAEILGTGKKETRAETIKRCEDMHIRKFPKEEESIRWAFDYVYAGKVVPSMRTLQFGGTAVERSNARAFNCGYAALTEWRDYSDLFYLLMCGTGTGYSVTKPTASAPASSAMLTSLRLIMPHILTRTNGSLT